MEDGKRRTEWELQQKRAVEVLTQNGVGVSAGVGGLLMSNSPASSSGYLHHYGYPRPSPSTPQLSRHSPSNPHLPRYSPSRSPSNQHPPRHSPSHPHLRLSPSQMPRPSLSSAHLQTHHPQDQAHPVRKTRFTISHSDDEDESDDDSVPVKSANGSPARHVGETYESDDEEDDEGVLMRVRGMSVTDQRGAETDDVAVNENGTETTAFRPKRSHSAILTRAGLAAHSATQAGKLALYPEPSKGLSRGILGSKSTTSIAALRRQQNGQHQEPVGRAAVGVPHQSHHTYQPPATTHLPFRAFPSAPFLPAFAKDHPNNNPAKHPPPPPSSPPLSPLQPQPNPPPASPSPTPIKAPITTKTQSPVPQLLQHSKKKPTRLQLKTQLGHVSSLFHPPQSLWTDVFVTFVHIMPCRWMR
ncbi:hypothetical protein BC829DRAFT_170825 [Chytridium lagenaria]|nr:hypothetical protein BC829DRAFT_170825 [Chytridium lagenaria]